MTTAQKQNLNNFFFSTFANLNSAATHNRLNNLLSGFIDESQILTAHQRKWLSEIIKTVTHLSRQLCKNSLPPMGISN